MSDKTKPKKKVIEPPAETLNAPKSILRAARAQGYAQAYEQAEGLSEERVKDLLGKDTTMDIRAEDGDDKMFVKIIGPIDSVWGFSAPALIRQIDRQQPKSITIVITSPGGYAFEAMALYQDLRALSRSGVHIKIEVRFLAGSAAAMLYLAGDERTITEGSSVMIHAPYYPFFMISRARNNDSTKEEFESLMGALAAIETQFIDILRSRAGQSDETARDWITGADQWFSSAEAVEHGLSHSLVADEGEGEDETGTDTDAVDQEQEGLEDEELLNAVDRVDRIVAHHLQEQKR